MSVIKSITNRSAIVGEVFGFLWARKLWWLVPLVVLILLAGLLFALAQASAVAPWMYPL